MVKIWKKKPSSVDYKLDIYFIIYFIIYIYGEKQKENFLSGIDSV